MGFASKSRLRSWFLLSVVLAALSVLVLQWTGVVGEIIDTVLPKTSDPDEFKDIEELIVSRGFNFSRHHVSISDGFRIEIHRMWREESRNSSLLPIVFGAHLLGISNSYVMDADRNAFPYANAGFDVWLLNDRGSRYCEEDPNLDPTQQARRRHDFTVVDLGAIDLAEQLDYILRETGQRKVNYVGVSQGATKLFALLAKKPSYNRKIAKATSLGGYRSGCYNHQAMFLPSILSQAFGDFFFEMISKTHLLNRDISFISRIPKPCEFTCVNILGFQSDYYLNFSRFGVYGRFFPAGTSLKNLLWMAQSWRFGCDGNMREFDYDHGLIPRLLMKLGLRSSKNLEKYGTTEPPILDAKNIDIDLKMYYSDGDILVPLEETFKIQKDLNVPGKNLHRIPDWRFSHFNFVIRKGPHAIDEHGEELIVSRGYNFSRHELVMTDGYRIEIHRMWQEKARNTSLLPVVIGAHLFGTSAIYVSDDHVNAFPFAKAGFDVWLLNDRGTRFGNKHSEIDPEKYSYDPHDFTVIEHGVIDLAEQLDYILWETGHEKVNYVGVSQGATKLFALLSKKPSYNRKIAKALSYGGYRSMCHNAHTKFFLPLLHHSIFGDSFLNVLRPGHNLDMDFSSITRYPKISEFVCIHFLDCQSMHFFNTSRFGVYGRAINAGTSRKNLKWMVQGRRFGCDSEMMEYDYDYGLLPRLLTNLGLRRSKNLEKYGSLEPPSLDSDNIKIDLKIYYTDGDALVQPEETFKLQKDLNVPDKNLHRIPDWRFSHYNFIMRKQPHAIDVHGPNFFKGIESEWNPMMSEDV
ncbi:uncharacterized protein LOC100906938 [Galendromus occidentalis]|uniref:Uncharacterized protein LOC100906938 n=1 Tax=Galendromus occidentalis TaxID=34638 RepID=A0AAJ7L5I6_9ACAR|nr:uncharacterized protein LOC100906938 [Galendromus occidentalis]